ncbi:MAG: CAP domain-containing protein [Linnemannia elongata]|nr:MAG: CAP domain-containing protein [Linnemannia elongata]
MAEPIGSINTGKGRLLPFTSSEFEAIERGEWPQSLPASEIPETTDEKFKASGLSGEEIQGILDHHNYYRSLHGAPALIWNWEAANFGENWLQYCAFQHSRGKFGENLAAGYNDFPAAIKAGMMRSENTTLTLPDLPLVPVVWKGTRSVGCAKWTIYICNYDPPGNIVTWDNAYFRDNVSPRW